jgi:hypothetical protein
MKTPVLMLAGMLLVAVQSAQAQSPVVFKYKANPQYSVHNYKQPDKAALAKKYNLNNLITLEYVESTPADEKARRNYKAPATAPQQAEAGGIVPATAPQKKRNSAQSPANYKRQIR